MNSYCHSAGEELKWPTFFLKLFILLFQFTSLLLCAKSLRAITYKKSWLINTQQIAKSSEQQQLGLQDFHS